MTTSRRPILAIVYGNGSVSATNLSEAASARCDLVWVVDATEFDNPATMRVLARMGTTLDIAGMSDDEAADALQTLQPNGIVAYADAHMARASALAGRLGLDYHDGAVTEALCDKLTQRRTLRAAGLPVPRCIDIPSSSTPDDVVALVGDIEFPAVLKPRHGAASRDTVQVRDASELGQLLTQRWRSESDDPMVVEAVSYTHLTLPTILRV